MMRSGACRWRCSCAAKAAASGTTRAPADLASSGIAVNALGHAHPAIVAAVTEADRHARARVQLLRHPRRSWTWPSGSSWLTGAGEAGGSSSATPAPRPTRPRSSWPGLNNSGGSHPHPRAERLRPRAHDGRPRPDRQTEAAEPFEPVPRESNTSTRPWRRSRPRSTTPWPRLFLEPVKGGGGVVDLPAGFLRRARALPNTACC